MPIQRNPFDAPVRKIIGEIISAKVRAQKANPVPLGSERVPASTVRARLMAMSPEKRAALLATEGTNALKMLETPNAPSE